ncbi:hypothetical protein AGMMS50293_10270 [Spirochaetia bacterium]|nr:hypothetical protein AGMMS50293_10270 [Spirochaetia bacterium]
MGSGSLDPNGRAMYSFGGGGELGFEADLSTLWPNPLGIGYTFGIEAAMMINPFQSDPPANTSFYSFGGSFGLYYFPLSRLFTRIDGAVGISKSVKDEAGSDPGPYWRIGGEIGFRFTPGFTLAANTGWREYYSNGGPLNSGMYAGLTAQITFQTGSASMREGVIAQLDQTDPVYPAFMQLYQTYPIGAVVLRNNENAEIRDVRLYFRAGTYTSSEYPCGTISVIPRGRSVELPLLADFSPEILRFTDSGRVMGELVIRYRFLGQEREAVRAITVATQNRNTIPTGDLASVDAVSVDTAVFAAFVTSTSPEVLDFARFIAGQDRTSRRIGHNANMQYAIWLLEGLRASGIMSGDTYATASTAQYPAETLAFRTGNPRDLAILYAAALEAVGVSSAFLTMSNEQNFLVAVNLGIDQSAAETLFNGTDKILVVDNQVWLPLSMSGFNDGFNAAWTQAAEILNRSFAENKQADFIIIQDAWQTYPPTPLPELGRAALRIDNAAATAAVRRTMTQYIETEITPLVQTIQAQVNATPTAALFNRLGIVLIRANRIPEAKTAYERAANMGSIPAMANRGNLALIELDYTTAERWFRQVLQLQPDNAGALRGITQIEGNR